MNRLKDLINPAIILIVLLSMTGCVTVEVEQEFKLGLAAYYGKRYQESLHHLDRSLEFDPNYRSAMDLRPWCLFKLNRIDKAEEYFSRINRESPKNINAVQGLAWIYFIKGKNEEARAFFIKQIELAGEHVSNEYWKEYSPSDQRYILSVRSDGNYGLGLIAEKKGDTNAAIAYFSNALDDPNQFMPEGQIALGLADLYYAKKNYKSAALLLESVVNGKEKADYKLLNKTAWAFYWQEKYAKSEKYFRKALTKKERAVDAPYGLAISLIRQRKFDEAKMFLKDVIFRNPYYADTAYVRAILEKQPGYWELWKAFGMAYYRLGNFPAARVKLSVYLRKIPDDYEALIAAGWSYRWSGLLVRAEEAFFGAGRLKHGQAEQHVGLGSTFLAAGRYEKAEEQFQRALSLNRSFVGAFNGLGHLYLKKGMEGKAHESFEKAIEADAGHFDSLAQLGLLFFQEKNYLKARSYYERLADKYPNAIMAYNMIGWCSYHLETYMEAENAFKKSEKINPYQVYCHYGLGLTYDKQGRKEEAKKALISAIRIAPAYTHTRFFKEMISANPGWESLYLELGWSYYRFRLYPQAINAFNACGAYSEKGREPARGRAWSHYWLGRYDDAYSIFKGLAEESPEDTDALIGMGWTLFNKKKYETALRIMDNITKKNPRIIQAWRTLAAIYAIKGDAERARNAYDMVARLEPRAFYARKSKGWSFFYRRQYVEAVKLFSASIKIAPAYGEPYYGLGLSYLRLGREEEGKKALLNAIYRYPSFMDNPSFYKILDSNRSLASLGNDMGWSYFYKQGYKKALFHFKRMLKKEAGSESALLGIGASLYMLGDYDGGIDAYSRLVERIPPSSKRWDRWSYMINNMGWCYYYKGDYEKAVSAFKQLDKYHEGLNFIAPLNGLGWCYLRLGEMGRAREAFIWSLKVLPGNFLAEKGMKAIQRGLTS